MPYQPIICTYCGSDSSIEREHVIPASFLGHRCYDSSTQWLVDACRTCNQLAGAHVVFSIPEKCKYLLKRYKTRYAKILRVPFWTDNELAEMDYTLRVSIEGSLVAKSILGQKLKHLEGISNYPVDYLRPKWVGRLMLETRKKDKEKLLARRRQLRKRRKLINKQKQ